MRTLHAPSRIRASLGGPNFALCVLAFNSNHPARHASSAASTSGPSGASGSITSAAGGIGQPHEALCEQHRQHPRHRADGVGHPVFEFAVAVEEGLGQFVRAAYARPRIRTVQTSHGRRGKVTQAVSPSSPARRP